MRRTDWTVRVRQVDAGQAAARVLLADTRAHSFRCDRHAAPECERTSGRLWRGATGDGAVFRHGAEQPLARKSARRLRPGAACLPNGRNPRDHRTAAAWISNRDRRAWRWPLWRSEAADRHRTRSAQTTARPG